MIFEQKEIQLKPYKRGFHSITETILQAFPEIKKIEKGFLKVFIKHTSASLTINVDADPSVRVDFESHFNKMVPENAPYYIHTYEGSDDMPAHLKASLLGSSVEMPITRGKLNLGTWQGIYLCEHRNYGGSRKLVLICFWGLVFIVCHFCEITNCKNLSISPKHVLHQNYRYFL